jgi:hypothetical protein
MTWVHCHKSRCINRLFTVTTRRWVSCGRLRKLLLLVYKLHYYNYLGTANIQGAAVLMQQVKLMQVSALNVCG